ncbi:MAG: transglutaminase family protein, partial [Microbacterium sp.]|nr:transglutaminase family protein [Microbacterium sp.]
MKRLRIEHATGFAYHGDVSASYNEARMLPGTTDSQFVLSSSLDIEPSTSVNSYVDYFGTRVSAFDVLSPHSELKITARSLVEVRPRPVEHGGLTWDDLAAQTARGIDTVEQLVQTNRTRPHEEVVELAARIAAEHDDPGRAAHDICIAVGDAVEYMYGVTGVHSTASEAWGARKGVCQDMAHIAIGALRSVGIPARYVSGYLHPRPDAEV